MWWGDVTFNNDNMELRGRELNKKFTKEAEFRPFTTFGSPALVDFPLRKYVVW